MNDTTPPEAPAPKRAKRERLKSLRHGLRHYSFTLTNDRDEALKMTLDEAARLVRPLRRQTCSRTRAYCA